MRDLDPEKLYRYSNYKKLYYIDIKLTGYGDVYSEWDYSPVLKRSIDDDLTEYLIDCSFEIPIKKKIAIYFYLPSKVENKDRENKSRQAIENHFTYLIRKAKIKRSELIKNSFLYAVIGISLLILTYISQSKINESSVLQIIPEGLLIGAWVIMWEIFTIIFFQLSSVRKKIKHYRRLQNAGIIYDYGD